MDSRGARVAIARGIVTFTRRSLAAIAIDYFCLASACVFLSGVSVCTLRTFIRTGHFLRVPTGGFLWPLRVD